MAKTEGLVLPGGGFLPFSGQNASGAGVGDAGSLATRSRSGLGLGFGNTVLPNPDTILRKKGNRIGVYESLLTHPVVAGPRRRRRAAVLALVRGLDVANYKGNAKVLAAVQQMLGSLPIDAILKKAHRAHLFGYQPQEINWEIRQGQYWPTQIDSKPCDWFHFDGDGALRFRVLGDPIGELCPREKFLLTRQEPSYANPYGEADCSLIFWSVAFYQGGMRLWVKFIEKYGMPFAIGKLPRSAKDEEYDELADELDAMVEDAIAVIPDDGSITLLERKMGGADAMHERLLAHCRGEINIALLGQNATTDGNVTHASASAGMGVTDDIRDDDASMVCETIQALIDVFCLLNFGIGPGETPKYRLSEKGQDEQTRAKRDATLRQAGLIFTPSYFERTYGLQAGDVDTAAMAARKSPPAPSGPVLDFAEPAALDLHGAVDAYLARILPGVTQDLIAPLMAAIRAEEDFDTLLDKLAALYPAMPDDKLRATLESLAFAVDMIGRLMVAEELADG